MKKKRLLNKIITIVLLIALLLIPFANLLNVKAEDSKIEVDTNKKVLNTTSLTIKVSSEDSSTDILKAYKVLDVYYDEATNVVSYKFTPEFSNFLKTSEDSKLINLTIDDYIAYGNINYELSNEEKNNIEKEYNSMVNKFAKYVRKGTNTLPKTYELTNNVGISKIATVEAGSYLILPTEFDNNPYYLYESYYYNYYNILIANATLTVENNNWILPACEVNYKVEENFTTAKLVNTDISHFCEIMQKLGDEGINPDDIYSTDMQLYNDKEYIFYFMISENDEENENTERTAQIILPEGLSFVDATSDLNNIYFVAGNADDVIQASSDGTLFDNVGDGTQYTAAHVKVESITTSNKSAKQITIVPTGNASDFTAYAIRVKLNSDKEKIVFGLDGNIIESSVTFVGDSNTDPITTRTINLQNKAFTYGLQILNKSQSDNSYLSGAVFGIYTDADCTDTNKVGELNIDETVENQPTGRYAGLPSGTYYVKQLKAATGYRLSTDVANITIDSANKDYFKLEVINTKMGLLPTTGGLGTIIYTLIGLIVIGIASYAIIKYSKRQINS